MSVTPLFVQADLEARISPGTVRRILDDGNGGAPDPAAVARLIDDASSTVWSYLPPTFTTTTDTVPSYLKKLALDVAVGTLFVRHPEYARADGSVILSRAMKDLESYKKQLTQVPEVKRDDVYGFVSDNKCEDNAWTRLR